MSCARMFLRHAQLEVDDESFEEFYHQRFSNAGGRFGRLVPHDGLRPGRHAMVEIRSLLRYVRRPHVTLPLLIKLKLQLIFQSPA